MSESALQDFVVALITMLEMEKPHEITRRVATSQNEADDVSLVGLQAVVAACMDRMPPPSESSRCWLEMILVQTTLQNNERFALLWPLISAHYSKMLGRESHVPFDYSTERRVVGLFKIASKMLGTKKTYSASILALIGSIFTVSSELRMDRILLEAERNAMDKKDSDISLKGPQPLPMDLLVEMSGQVAAGMFQLLSTNITFLPLLALEQWQILFDGISLTAAAGGYASIKAFETMAWLLHEPRLRAEVPVFCVVAVKPLLKNIKVPVPVSIGAVNLLYHLHTRLEVLVKDDVTEAEYKAGYATSDTPVLWESCWAPILRALADGAADPRQPVRVAAVDALSHAILDKHTKAVPGEVMLKILQDIVVPTVRVLGDSLLQSTMNAESEFFLVESPGEQVLEEVLREYAEQKYTQLLGGSSDESDEPAAETSSSRGELPHDILQKVLVGVSQTRMLQVGPASECMAALSKAFLQHLKRLSLTQSFDSLWLRILDLFSFFLLSSENGGKFDGTIVLPESVLTIKNAYELLRSILHALARGGLFESHYKVRWMTTYNKIIMLNGGLQMLEDVFQAFSKDAVPVVKPSLML